MIKELPSQSRELRTVRIHTDFVVVGGGLAGVCAAITAARSGLEVALIHDRPVLGGNASSEVRLWALGASCHMGSNNRWAREGGVIDEILVENLYRNPEGNPLIFDTIILEKVAEEPSITLLLNTAAFSVDKSPSDPDCIAAVRGFCSQNSTVYECHAGLFCDSSGDGIIGFLSGAAFRMGAESREEFDEPFAPSGDFGGLLGHSIYFYSKNVGRSVKFTPPSFALKDIPSKIPRYKDFKAADHGCVLWWIEWGGRLDTVHESEKIKWELWRIVYGVWDYIKNSGRFPEAENLALEWVGHVPGKRESRRFEGDHVLRQSDIVHRPHHEDAVAFGGWSIDLHPADGVFADIAGSHHLHSKGVYQIPYRCYYSRNIRNLFLAGRIISTSHVAFGTTRVMATCAHGGQAVGFAAALCRQNGWLPRDVVQPARMRLLQRELLRSGQHIPGYRFEDFDDLARKAAVTATSALGLGSLPADGPARQLDRSLAQMIPLTAGKVPRLSLLANVEAPTSLVVQLRLASSPSHHSPDTILAERKIALESGNHQLVSVDFDTSIELPQYAFACFLANEKVSLVCTEKRITGLLTVRYSRNEQTSHVGGEDYEVWTPERRPGGRNIALTLEPPICAYEPENILNGLQRPTDQPNAWVASLDDPAPALTLTWPSAVTIESLELFFDVDYDHAMESVLYGHPERAVPFCVKDYRVLDDSQNLLLEVRDNHHARNVHRFTAPAKTRSLRIEVMATHSPHSPAAIMEVRAYGPAQDI